MSSTTAADCEGRLVTRRLAATLLDVSPTTVDRWINAGELRAIRRRGYTRIFRSSIEEFEQRNSVRPNGAFSPRPVAEPKGKPNVIEPRSASAMVVQHLAPGRRT